IWAAPIIGKCRTVALSAWLLGLLMSSATAQDAGDTPTPARNGSTLPEPPGAKRLDPNCDVWVDMKLRRVILQGRVCFREGPLELFACLTNTKEHESIIAVRTKSFVVHTALLAVGAKPGAPVEFLPEYKPAHGTPIDVLLFWTDQEGHRQKA